MAVIAAIPVVGGLIKDIVDRAFPDKTEAARINAQLQANMTQERLAQLQADLQLALGQQDINKVEAANPSIFVSGWRPAIGWSCAVAIFTYYVPYAIATTGMWVYQCIHTSTLVARPDFGITDLLGLVGTLLGLAGMRTAEKFKGVAAV